MLFECTKTIFSKMYPRKEKKTWTRQGSWLRKLIKICLWCHITFTLFNFLWVGFTGFFVNLMLTFWCMSCYYTLNQCSIIIYIVFLIMAIIFGIFDELLGWI